MKNILRSAWSMIFILYFKLKAPYIYEAGPGTVAQKIFGVPRHLPEHIAIVRGFMRTYLQIFTCRTVQLVEKLVKNRVFDPWQVLANHS